MTMTTTRGKRESQTSWKSGCEEGNSEKNHLRPLGRNLSNSSLGPQGSHGLSLDEEGTEAAQESRQPFRMEAPSAPLLPRAHLTSVRHPRKPVHNSGPQWCLLQEWHRIFFLLKMKVNAKKDLPLYKVSPSKCFQTENDFKTARAT